MSTPYALRPKSTPNLRRSSRIQVLAKTNEENENKPAPKTKYQKISSSQNTTDNDSESPKPSTSAFREEIEKELESVEEDIQKPSELFGEDDVCGKKMYGFQTPMKKHGMIEKANLYRTPETPKSSKTVHKLKTRLEQVCVDKDTNDNLAKKTPGKGKQNETKQSRKKQNEEKEQRFKTQREKLSRGRFYGLDLTSSESESVSEDSEYQPCDDDKSEESEDDTTDENDENDENDEYDAEVKAEIAKMKSIKKRTTNVLNTPKKGNKCKAAVSYKDYNITTDDYFTSQAEKSVTSNHTLSKLKNPRMTEEKLQVLLEHQNHISEAHKETMNILFDNCMTFFRLWYFIMEEGHTLLLYGVGSKRNLINAFHKKIQRRFPSIVVNGFFPSLTIKDILDGIIDLLDLQSSGNLFGCVDNIKQVLKENPNDHLFLFIHNIDGVMLRNATAQTILSQLAAIPNIRMMVSVDHVNTPLLWDYAKQSKFNFYWCDVTTFLPYQEETSYESSLLVQQSGALALSSLQNVFLSLTSNARSIYIILAKYQLENTVSSNFTGMAFKDLYRAAREKFLVSSDLALRAQLTEFLDHKLVKTKRNIDGTEYLTIPLTKTLLKQFLEQHDQ